MELIASQTRGQEAASPAAPASVRLGLAPGMDVEKAQAFTRDLAQRHYENFSVVSFLLPRRFRQDFCNIYAFCRIADDLGDELEDKADSTLALADLREKTHACFAGACDTQLFVALNQTVRRHQIPIAPFLDLIDAFEQDQRINRYQTFDQLLDYCRRSANPVGRLVLYLCGYSDAQRQALSDLTCTALQLTNFWQDVRRDKIDRDRIYLPREHMDRFGVTEEQIQGGICSDAYRRLIQFEVDATGAMFYQGRGLLPLLEPDIRRQISLFSHGGEAILQAIRQQRFDTLSRRPRLSRIAKLRLAIGAMFGISAGAKGAA